MDPKLAKWIGWLDPIEEDITQLVWSKSIYLKLTGIITTNPEIHHGNRFWNWISTNYVESSLMGMRRQTDNGPDTITLFKLISDIEENSTLITREFHKSLYPAGRQCYADAVFDELASRGSTHYPQASAERDKQSLENLRDSFESYVDRRLAHLDKRPPSKIGQFQDVYEGIDTLERLLKHHCLLLRAQDVELLPVVQYDWKSIFRVPWIKPES